jgi:histone deacetylase 6
MKKVGLIYDEEMLKHEPIDDHPECPSRISRIFNLILKKNLDKKCKIYSSRKATINEIALVHPMKHIFYIKRNSKEEKKGDNLYWNLYTYDAALYSSGCLIELVDRVLKDEIDYGIAIVRPPGHHAEREKAQGFC